MPNKNNRIHIDDETKRWAQEQKNRNVQFTAVYCWKCGLYYNAELWHTCNAEEASS